MEGFTELRTYLESVNGIVYAFTQTTTNNSFIIK